MATLRNLALSRHRIAGATNIAAASRHVGRHPNRILPLLTYSQINYAEALGGPPLPLLPPSAEIARG